MTNTDLPASNILNRLAAYDACGASLLWVADQSERSPEALWASCSRGDWLLWLARQLGLSIPEAAYRPAALRALRVYAPRSLRIVGLDTYAEKLEALPDDVDWAEAESMAKDAAIRALELTTPKAEAVIAALEWAEDAAEDGANEWARAASAAGAAAALEWAAVSEADEEAKAVENEHKRCADEVRATLGDSVIAAWTAAMVAA